MAGQPADVFVSYKAEDRSRLQPLVDALEAEGFSVWWDAHIGGGTNWHEDIEEHLESARCVVVAWSKRSVRHEGQFVREEARRAQRRGVYLPIRLDTAEPPLGFGEIQAISLKGWHGERSDPHFRAIAEVVRRRIGGDKIAYAAMPSKRPGVTRRALLAGGTSIVALAGLGGWLLFKPAPANAKRIAVLPFADLSQARDQAYFSEGVAEELRSALSRIGLQVIGRNSCEAVKNLDIKTAAAKLGVANILTGSVRRSPETIRVSAQLVSGKDGVERWAQTYDRAPGDAIRVQTDIAINVAQALSIALDQAGRAALTLGGTADSVAQDLVLQSRKLGRESDTTQAMSRRGALADAAIARDPHYADAYVEKAIALYGLAVSYSSSPAEVANELADAEAAARKAEALAPGLGSVHAALAQIAQYRLDLPSALQQTKQSLLLSPAEPDVLSVAARTMTYLVDPQEGLRLADRAIALDPLNGRLYRRKSEVLTLMRQYSLALEAGRKALELAPEVHNARIWIGDSLLFLGQPAKAKVEYEAMGADDPIGLARLALLSARGGDVAEAKRTMARLRHQVGAAYSYQYEEIYVQLGDKNRAFAEFDNALRARDSGLLWLKLDPFVDPIRSDPRYAALVRKLNFP